MTCVRQGNVRTWGVGALASVLLAGSVVAAGEVRKFEGHADAVTGVCFLADGLRAVSCGHDADRTVRVWDLTTGRELKRFASDTGFSALAASSDGTAVLAAGRDHVLRLWAVDDPPTAAPRRFEGHGDLVNHVTFASDGKTAASTSWDSTLRLWDVVAGKEVRRFEGHQGSVNGVTFSPDGRRLATGGADHSVRLWDASTGKEVRTFDGHTGWVGDVAFSPDGRRIGSGGGKDEPVVLLWDTETGAVERRFVAPPDAGWAVGFAGGGCLLAVKADAVAAFDAATGRETARLAGHTGQIYALAVSRDGRRVLTGGADRTVRLWDLGAASNDPPSPPADPLARAAALRRELENLDDPNQARPREYAFRRAAREAAAGYPVVPATSLKSKTTEFAKVVMNARRKGFDAVKFRTPAGPGAWDLHWEYVVPAGPNGAPVRSVYILAAEGDMRGFVEYSFHRDEPIEGLDLPRNLRVVQSLRGGQLRPGAEYFLWFLYEDGAAEVPTYVKLRLDATHPATVAAAHRDAEVGALEMPEGVVGLGIVGRPGRGDPQLLVASGGDAVTVDLATGRTIGRRPLGTQGGRFTAFSPDGLLALVLADDPVVRLVDLATGNERHALRGKGTAPRSVAFSPDGRSALAGFEDGTVRLWDVATGAEVRTFEGHTDQVFALAFAPDGRRFVSGASVADPVARVWDVVTGNVLARLKGNAQAVYAAAFSPDGRSVLTGGEDDSVRLFDAATGLPLREFEKKAEENVRAVAFLPDGRRALSAGDELGLRLWDVGAGESIARFSGHGWPVGLLAVSPDGRYAVSADNFGVVRIWRLPASPSEPRRKRRGH